MQVKVTEEFRAVPAGKVYPERFRVGDVVDGRIAEIAIEMKRGEMIIANLTKIEVDGNKATLTAPDPSKTDDQTAAQQTIGSTTGADKPDANGTTQTNVPPSTPTDAANVQATEKPQDKPKTVVVRARLKDRYEGVDEKGKPVKFAKASIVAAPWAQKLVDEDLAVVLETKSV